MGRSEINFEIKLKLNKINESKKKRISRIKLFYIIS